MGQLRVLILSAVGLLVAGLVPLAQASHAPNCFGRHPTIVSTDQPGILVGTPNNDVIVGLGGGDDYFGSAGFDFVCGNAGEEPHVDLWLAFL